MVRGKIICILITMALMYACIVESETFSTFYFENKSGVTVYIPEGGLDNVGVNIENGETFKVSGGEMGGEIYNPFGYVEELDVFFNGDKVIHYELWRDIDDPMNPLILDNYIFVDETKKKGRYIYKFYYTFTVEQYESAEPYEP